MGTVTSSKITFVDSNNPESLLNPKHFADVYHLGEEIGAGSFASVCQCFRKDSEPKSAGFAVKIINTTYLTQKELIGLRTEICILQRMSHPNIIRLFDVFDDNKNVSMVLELCNGNDLFDEIVASENNHFTESKSAQIVSLLSGALLHLHTNGVIHRDLKPENILFGVDGTIKITDFGLAHYSPARVPTARDNDCNDTVSLQLNTCCGTPHYVAPEVICKLKYNHKCDLWSLGVILYIMLVGYQPFNADKLPDIYKRIANADYNFNSVRWIPICVEAKDLIGWLLEVDPNKRFDTRDIMQHPFITKHTKQNHTKMEIDTNIKINMDNIYTN